MVLEQANKVTDMFFSVIEWFGAKYQKMLFKHGALFILLASVTTYVDAGVWKWFYFAAAVLVLVVMGFIMSFINTASNLRQYKNELSKLVGAKIESTQGTMGGKLNIRSLFKLSSLLKTINTSMDTTSEIIDSWRSLLLLVNPLVLIFSALAGAFILLEFVFACVYIIYLIV